MPPPTNTNDNDYHYRAVGSKAMRQPEVDPPVVNGGATLICVGLFLLCAIMLVYVRFVRVLGVVV